MLSNTQNNVKHRSSFKTKSAIKKEYVDLVKFCDELLLGEDKLKKEIAKLETAIEILNHTSSVLVCEDAYREGQKDLIEDLVSKCPHLEREILSALE